MYRRLETDAILITNPLKLLYWLFFRGLALRRYARSIHEDLDENLNVWEVRHVVGDDPRFRALCRARWQLLAGAPLTATVLVGLISFVLSGEFSWLRGFIASTGFSCGAFIAEALCWRFPRSAGGWISTGGLIFVLILTIGQMLTPSFPILQYLYLPMILDMLGLPYEIHIAVMSVAFGVAVGVAFGVAGGVAGG
ncbi:MAG: hypothetical protein HC914_16260, partial [Chloroflexaceae bacterium]|nr:hypothetical protein [Chloroflexaceae bacterium]